MKCGLQREQGFEGSIRSRAFIHFENNFLPLRLRTVRSGKTHRDRHNLVVESSSLNGSQCFLVTAQGEFVRRRAGDTETLADALRGKAHVQKGARIVFEKPWIG